MPKRSIASLIEENKTVFIIIAIGLFLIELEIFAVAAIKSGRDYKLQVLDDNGNLIHETAGKNLSDFNKYYFEKTFGPLDQYQIKLVTKDIPFPFRAWFVSAVGIPIGVILMFAFVVKAYMSIFYGEEIKEQEKEAASRQTGEETRLEKLVETISRFNIFTIGFIILLLVISYWIIPEVIMYAGKLGEETILKYRWFFLAAIIAVFGVFVWIIYLRYLLAKKTIDSQTEMDMMRLQIEMKQGDMPIQVEYQLDKKNSPRLVGWDRDNNDKNLKNKDKPGKKK